MRDSTQALHIQARNHKDYSWAFTIYSQALDKAGLTPHLEELASANNQMLILENSSGAGQGAKAEGC